MEAALAVIAAEEAEAKEEVFDRFAVGPHGIDGIATWALGETAHGVDLRYGQRSRKAGGRLFVEVF